MHKISTKSNDILLVYKEEMGVEKKKKKRMKKKRKRKRNKRINRGKEEFVLI